MYVEVSTRTERSLVNMHHLASLPASHKLRSLLVEGAFINLTLEVAVPVGRQIRIPDVAPALTACGRPAELPTVQLRHPPGHSGKVVAGKRLPGLGQSVAGVDGLPAGGSRHPGGGICPSVRHQVQVLGP